MGKLLFPIVCPYREKQNENHGDHLLFPWTWPPPVMSCWPMITRLGHSRVWGLKWCPEPCLGYLLHYKIFITLTPTESGWFFRNYVPLISRLGITQWGRQLWHVVSHTKPGMLQSLGLQKVRYNLVTEQQHSPQRESDYKILKYVLARNTCFP